MIDESEEHILNIDNTHLRGYSTPGKYIKECRDCELAEDCEDKVSTDETADWYIKGKYKCYYAHQIGMSQLADSGAPLGCVVLNGKQFQGRFICFVGRSILRCYDILALGCFSVKMGSRSNPEHRAGRGIKFLVDSQSRGEV